jgi:hypothetical protein
MCLGSSMKGHKFWSWNIHIAYTGLRWQVKILISSKNSTRPTLRNYRGAHTQQREIQGRRIFSKNHLFVLVGWNGKLKTCKSVKVSRSNFLSDQTFSRIFYRKKINIHNAMDLINALPGKGSENGAQHAKIKTAVFSV